MIKDKIACVIKLLPTSPIAIIAFSEFQNQKDDVKTIRKDIMEMAVFRENGIRYKA